MAGVCQTRSGLSWNILDPDPNDVLIEDIAHALSNQCRYNGHTREFYSVAEHSVRVASCLPVKLRLAGLMHDTAEAYVGDIVRPLKPLLKEFKEIEQRTMVAILEGLGLSGLDVDHELVEYADKNTILATEGRDLMSIECWEKWAPDLYSPEFVASALPDKIIPWSNIKARQMFMDAYLYLTDEQEPIYTREMWT